MFAGLKLAVPSQLRPFPAKQIQAARNDDRGEASEHDGREDLREEIALCATSERGVADRKWNRAFADAAGHDWNDDHESSVLQAKSKRRSETNSHRGGSDRTGDDWSKNLQEATDQHPPVHP